MMRTMQSIKNSQPLPGSTADSEKLKENLDKQQDKEDIAIIFHCIRMKKSPLSAILFCLIVIAIGLTICVALGTIFSWVTSRHHCPPAHTIYPCFCLPGTKDVEVTCFNVTEDDLEHALKNIHHSIGMLNIESSIFPVLRNDTFSTTSTTFLHIMDSNISNIETGAFEGLPDSIEIFTLYGNNIDVLPGDMFEGFTNLEHLILFKNNIRTLSPGVFNNLKNLNTLRLKDNIIQDIDSLNFTGMTKLQELYLDRSGISLIRADMFEDLQMVRLLSVQDNHISTVPAMAFVSMNNLEEIYLDDNKITYVAPGAFAGVGKTLITLSLTNNNLTTFPADSFSQNSPLPAEIRLNGTLLF